MDAEIEVISGELVEPEDGSEAELAPARPQRGLVQRARHAVGDPRVQGAAAATAGMLVGATTLALMRRAGRAAGVASALRDASPLPVGPSQAGWPPGPTIGPIQPGTYIVRVRAIGGLAPQQQSQ